MTKGKVHITTLGCSKNGYDSDILGGLLEKQGLILTDQPEESDIVLINTCGFIAPAKEESVNAILEAGELKKEGKIKKLLVVGCLSARYKEELMKEIPEVDAFFGTEDYKNILNHLHLQISNKSDYYENRHVEPGQHVSYIKIGEGCNHTCAYCAIPLMRGRYRSRYKEDIVREAEILADRGTKELILISQDTTFYGLDLYKKQELIPLLEQLEKIEGIEWIRLHYFYPTTIPKGLVDFMKNSDKVLPYVDIPLQHISDRMLNIMKRGGNKQKIMSLLNEFREKLPEVAIRTTFIVGHPGEEEEDFQELLSFIKSFKFDRLGVFKYSPEEDTSAFEMGDIIPEDVKEERYNAIMSAQQDISLSKNEALLGKVISVIIDEYNKNDHFLIGRTYMDSPEIDNEVIIEDVSDDIRIGEIVNVSITDFDAYELYGRIVT
ncbi:MAG: 30S ribosomal protein S12 methylthiotransferase RimO [Calditrichia bacterium]